MAKAKKAANAENETDQDNYGKTGYATVLQEEGKEPVEGFFISDEDFTEYQELKQKAADGHYISNEDAEYGQSLDEENHNLKKQITAYEQQIESLKQQAADQQASKETAQAEQEKEVTQKQAPTLADIYGPDYVEAVNGQNETKVFSAHSWERMDEEFSKGKPTGTKLGGWKVKTETPDEVKALRNGQNNS